MNGKNTFKGLLIMIPACAPRVSVYCTYITNYYNWDHRIQHSQYIIFNSTMLPILKRNYLLRIVIVK